MSDTNAPVVQMEAKDNGWVVMVVIPDGGNLGWFESDDGRVR